MDPVKSTLSFFSTLIILRFYEQGGIHAFQMCSPLANVTFSWNYDNLDPRSSTVWTFEGVAIMSKVGENKAEDLNTTQFMGRIAEDEGSNAGIVIYNLAEIDSGQYEVTVRFNSVGPFTASEDLVVDSDAVPLEVNRSTEITVDGKPLETYEAHVIGNPGLHFTFDIKGACIAAPDIDLEFEKQDGTLKETCKSAFKCSETYTEAGNLYVNVTVIGYNSNLRFPSSGFYEIQDVASDVPCKDRIECIVPATVVPVSVVVIAVIVVLVVLKPCSK